MCSRESPSGADIEDNIARLSSFSKEVTGVLVLTILDSFKLIAMLRHRLQKSVLCWLSLRSKVRPGIYCQNIYTKVNFGVLDDYLDALRIEPQFGGFLL